MPCELWWLFLAKINDPSTIPVVYADAALVVVDKPGGLLSVPGRRPEHQDSAQVRVAQRFGAALVVHRLDCHTSGLLVFALTPTAQAQLNKDFRERAVFKEYRALTHGHYPAHCGQISEPLLADWPARPRQKVCYQHGKKALTRYRIIRSCGHQHYVQLFPVTGRSHQLRVHSQVIGAPIMGDRLYAPAAVVAQAERLMLHAYRLILPHPVTREQLSFTAAVPFGQYQHHGTANALLDGI